MEELGFWPAYHSTKVIYIAILILITALLIALPFIEVTVSIDVRAILQADKQRIPIIAPSSGYVTKTSLEHNRGVSRGDLLLRLSANRTHRQRELITIALARERRKLQDLNNLQAAHPNNDLKLSSGLYNAEWNAFLEEYKIADLDAAQALRDFRRYELLYHRKVITRSEYEMYQHNFDKRIAACLLVVRKYQNIWQKEGENSRHLLKQLEDQEDQLHTDLKNLELRSPEAGTIYVEEGVAAGSFVQGGQQLAEISPKGEVVLMCYVPSLKIADVRTGQMARVEIDAYRQGQWNAVPVKVVRISDDMILQAGQPVFEVKCKLANNYILSKSGHRGVLRKGMTATARFVLARKSLLQLIFERTDNLIAKYSFYER